MTLEWRPPSPDAQRIVLGACLVLGVFALSVLISNPSTARLAMTVGVLGLAIYALLTRQLQRPLLALLIFTAPIEITKALVAPMASRYHAGGPYYSPGVYVSLAHMALLALAAVWLARRWLLERRLPPMTQLDALVLLYAAFIWVRSVGSPQGVLSAASAMSYSLALLAYYVASHTIRTASDTRLVLRASLAVLLLTVLYAAAQFATRLQLELPGMKPLAAGSTIDLGGGAMFRPPGFLSHPNALAHYLVIALPPAMALALLGPKRLPKGAWLVALLAAGAAGATLLVTFSRGGWASALLSVGVIVAIYHRRGLITTKRLGWVVALAALGAIALVIIYPKILLRLTASDGRSLESRVLLADMAWTMIQSNPWFGVGFGDYNRAAFHHISPALATVSADYQFALHQLVVHNHYMLLAAELGIPAALFFVYLLWRFVRLPFPLHQWRHAATFGLAVGLGASAVGQALFFNSDNYYADTRVFLFWLYAGVLQALSLQATREGRA